MSAAPGQAFDPLKDLLDHDPEPLRDPLGILPELKADINAFAVLLRPVRSQEQHQELIAPGQGPAARLGPEVGRPVRVLVGGRQRRRASAPPGTFAPRAERNVSPERGPLRAGASSGYPVLPWPHAQSRGNRSVRSVVSAVPIQQIDQGQRPGCWSTRGETGTMTHNTIPGALRPLLGLLVIGLVAIGCTSANAKTAEMGASCDQFGAQKSITQTTEMSVGDQIKVTLCSNPSTGFSWQEPEISDTGAVSLADKSFGAPVAGAAQVVGAAGTDYITLKATAKGTATVVLRYSQPWLGGTSSEWTYSLTVTVR